MKYFFQKAQVVYPRKHLAPTEVLYVGFNSNNYKDDKVFGGALHVFLVCLLVVGSFISSFGHWWNDDNPYMSSLAIPYTIDGLYTRSPIVYQHQVSTLFFKIVDYKFTSIPMEEVEQYLNLEIVNHYF